MLNFQNSDKQSWIPLCEVSEVKQCLLCLGGNIRSFIRQWHFILMLGLVF